MEHAVLRPWFSLSGGRQGKSFSAKLFFLQQLPHFCLPGSALMALGGSY